MPVKARLALVIIVAAALSVLLFVRFRPSRPAGLTLSGTLGVTSVDLSFKVSGRLAQRLVDEGMTVAAGQAVAVLEHEELKQERDARAADLQAANAILADLQAGSRREEIGQVEAARARVQAESGRLSRDAERAEELYRREVIPRRELDAALTARDSAAAAEREVEQQLRLLKAGPRPDAVRLARARVSSATAALAAAETRLSQARLMSPLGGIVLAKHAEPGEMLMAGAPVITVGNINQIWLRGYIPETELGRVAVGQIARVSLDSWPGRTFEGRISFISSEAEFTPKNVQTEKERVKLVYRIKIALPNPNGELKPGMPADAVIIPR